MIKHSSLRTPLYSSRIIVLVLAVVLCAAAMLMPHAAWADTISDLYSTSVDKSEFYDYGTEDVEEEEETSIGTFSLSTQSSSVTPMSFSDEMLYFCKYESSQNYDQGLSSGDYYHAMGYFQFDNRYGLGNFLEAVYEYDPDTFGYALRGIGETYGWDVSGTTYADGSLTQLGNDLNWAWHTAYASNPTLFSQLQNGWAYQQYYSGSTGVRGSLAALGINLDARPDCVKGLVWGMTNLFGAGGGASYINNGLYYGANWFFKNSGINDSMSDAQLVTTLCNYVVNNVESRYPWQSKYREGWQNRYRNELNDCLSYLPDDGSMFRLYNPNSGEHFYTSNSAERSNLVSVGWIYEGIGWVAPISSGTPVYRLYNPNAGDHHYTTDASERDYDVRMGWIYEGIGWYSDDAKGTAILRQYNPNAIAGSHNFTTDASERDMLVRLGWISEGVAWYGL